LVAGTTVAGMQGMFLYTNTHCYFQIIPTHEFLWGTKAVNLHVRAAVITAY